MNESSDLTAIYSAIATSLTIIITLVPILIFMWKELRGWRIETKEEIKNHSARTDKIYETFLEMDKKFLEQRKESDERFEKMNLRFDQKFYDLLKEKK